ncbi:RepB family plasmid replication initiator protein [Lactococcus kimchii]|uniref:RepB family plasmid replication initiator protein n=1 Tax=Lactococcus sp. S-13 TaxID=2507158 RepID=UPI001022A355|nr:RepB family plasmid replication initiator protein [Lactococcus sp. S-13]RZI47904.1 RepB family plasmid replication initiator protein [Lactococcus sp. S-13]
MLEQKNTEELQYQLELNSRKVAQHNDLITSVAKMDKTPLKIFELAVSCIDTKNPPKDNIVYLSKKEVFDFFKVTDNDKHTRFREAIEKMQKTAYFEIREEQKKGFKFRSIIPIPEVEWTDYSDEVLIRFDIAIMPYLIELGTKFTQYAISDIIELQSKYSIILYKWFCMFYNQFETYQFSGERNQAQLYDLNNPKISVNKLRELTDTLEDYKRFDNFEKRVIKDAINEISLHTHFNITYEKIKKGRSIDSIQFHIVKKINWKDENYKRNDVQAQLTEEQKQAQNQVNYAVAVSNPLTMKLITASLLSAADIANQDTILGLAESVYPIYDKLVKELGEDALETHMSYVRKKMVDYTETKKNIVKYLSVAATQYLNSRLSQQEIRK